TRAREQRLQERGGIRQPNPLFRQNLRHAADQGVRVLLLQTREQLHQLPIRPDGRKNLSVLHLAGHHYFADPLFFEDFNQPRKLPERDPIAAFRELFHLRRRLFLDGQDYHFITSLSRCFQCHQGKPPIARDDRVAAHFTNPRSLRAIKFSNSVSSGHNGTSSRISSTACVVFSPDFVSSRNALCRLSMLSRANPRRSSPTLFSPKTRDSRGVTVIEYGNTSCVTTL